MSLTKWPSVGGAIILLCTTPACIGGDLNGGATNTADTLSLGPGGTPPNLGSDPTLFIKSPHTKLDFDGDGFADLALFRPSTAEWLIRSAWNADKPAITQSWGVSGDIPVPNDYDGDGIVDIAVWRPKSGQWWIKYSASGAAAPVAWGMAGDVPVPCDYDGDGVADIAVWRPSNATWYIINSRNGRLTTLALGSFNDLPVPADYDGDGKDDVAVFTPAAGEWKVLGSTAGSMPVIHWGQPGDIPVPFNPKDAPLRKDISPQAVPTVYRPSTKQLWTYPNGVTSGGADDGYGGLQTNDVPVFAPYFPQGPSPDVPAFWNPGTGMWKAPDQQAIPFGQPGDIPVGRTFHISHVKADYDGDGKSDRVVWRPGSGTWFKLFADGSGGSAAWGQVGDMPVVGDFDGDGRADLTVLRPPPNNYTDGNLMIYGSQIGSFVAWRTSLGDWPISGDFDGDGLTDRASVSDGSGPGGHMVWRISTVSGGVRTVTHGDPGDFPVPGDYDGDGITDIAVFRYTTGQWWIINSSGGGTVKVFGGGLGDRAADIPTPGDFDGDGITDLAFFRTMTSQWFVRRSTLGDQVTQFGDFATYGDRPVVGDYDGDGRADLAIWRPTDGSWHIIGSSAGMMPIAKWGAPTDVPVEYVAWMPAQQAWSPPVTSTPPMSMPPASQDPMMRPPPPATMNPTCGQHVNDACCPLGQCQLRSSNGSFGGYTFCSVNNVCKPCGFSGESCCFHFATNQPPDCNNGGVAGCNPDTGTCY